MADLSNSSNDLRLVVVTPETTVLDVTAEFVAVPLFDGEKGIGRLHAPMIGRLGYGPLRFRFGGETTVYYVDGGFVQVQDNVVSILTNRALATDQIDLVGADEQLVDAIARKPSNDEEMAIRDRLILQARAQKRLASK
ncbi:F0F1 ATP synthase subunit epsilon [Aeoliella mucimassa]|uniref:ATP synthase epsilon chain n=1 Tax=Aeoliella mucimassa TaxID=2527972 RepID=A0A518ANS6_9BACT|nr:F0F1 ATP synthase subunit epsilon [Aeoliella mucimassa]QDU56370.1 ATP synthase epsilon chain, sodium ion specific [Aeoliella mucimassa]